VTTRPNNAAVLLAEAARAGVAVAHAGTVTSEATLKIATGPSISVADLRAAHEGWFPAYMSGEL
jgi:phosphoribosylformylglycinamidine synthase